MMFESICATKNRLGRARFQVMDCISAFSSGLHTLRPGSSPWSLAQNPAFFTSCAPFSRDFNLISYLSS